MNTHLKGRIIQNQGISYLVMHENDSAEDWLNVKSLGPKPEIRKMRREEVLSCLMGSGQARNRA